MRTLDPVERLERRRLYATVPVQAVVNDGLDDTALVQAAINSAGPGDVVAFPAGVFDLSSPLVLAGGRTYAGAPGAVLLQHAANQYTAKLKENADGSDTALTGLTFQRGGIQLNAAGTATNVRVTGCTFENLAPNTGTFQSGNGIWSTTWLSGAEISGNTFRNFAGTGIQAYRLADTTVSGNTFTNVGEGIHFLFDDPGTGADVTVADNAGTGIVRIAIEIQGTGVSGLRVTGNAFTDWSAAATDVKMGLSVVAAGIGTVVSGNTLSGTYECVFGIELSGSDLLAEQNTIDGFQDGIVLATAPGAVVRANTITRPSFSGIRKYNNGTAPNLQIAGNAIVDPQFVGIGLGDGLWSGEVTGNVVTRGVGSWPGDAAPAQAFRGIHFSPPLSPSLVGKNAVRQTAAGVAGYSSFQFLGIANFAYLGDAAGTAFTNNTVESTSSTPFGVGFFGNAPGAFTGLSLWNNTFRNLTRAGSGQGGTFAAGGNQRFRTAAGGFLPTTAADLSLLRPRSPGVTIVQQILAARGRQAGVGPQAVSTPFRSDPVADAVSVRSVLRLPLAGRKPGHL